MAPPGLLSRHSDTDPPSVVTVALSSASSQRTNPGTEDGSTNGTAAPQRPQPPLPHEPHPSARATDSVPASTASEATRAMAKRRAIGRMSGSCGGRRVVDQDSHDEERRGGEHQRHRHGRFVYHSHTPPAVCAVPTVKNRFS